MLLLVNESLIDVEPGNRIGKNSSLLSDSSKDAVDQPCACLKSC